MKKSFIYDPVQQKMVELTREPVPLYTGTALDPESVDAAVPRALREICSMDEYRNMGSRELAAAMGFKNLETVKRTWSSLLCFAFLLLTCSGLVGQVPPYFTPGVALVDGQRLSAAEAMNLIQYATLNYTFVSTMTGETVLSPGDNLFVLTSGNQYRKISANNFLLNNTNWYSNAAQETNVSTNAFVLVWDGGTNSGQIFKVGMTNWLSVNAAIPVQTNWLNDALLGVYDTSTGLSWSESWRFIGTNWINWFSFTNNPANSTNGIQTVTNVADGDLVPWFNSTAQSNEVASWKTLKNSVTNAAIVGSSRNLVFMSRAYEAADPSTSYGYLTADEVVLKRLDGTGTSYLCKNLNTTVSTTAFVSTAPWGGVDTNNVVSMLNQWYYVWVISDGTNNGAIFSTNTTAPYLPNTNVSYAALVGAIRSDSSGYFPAFVEMGRQCYITPTNLLFGLIPTNYGTVTPMTATNVSGTTNLQVNFNTMVPPISKTVSGNGGSGDNGADAGLYLSSGSGIFSLGAITAPGEVLIRGKNTTVLKDYFTFGAPFTIPVRSVTGGVIIYWHSIDATATNSVTITGYSL